jgi:hypothetical protein
MLMGLLALAEGLDIFSLRRAVATDGKTFPSGSLVVKVTLVRWMSGS